MNDSAHPDRLGAKEATQEERVGRPVDVESQTCNDRARPPEPDNEADHQRLPQGRGSVASNEDPKKEKDMSDHLFAGLTEAEWADLEWAERYDPNGECRGLVFLGPAKFAREHLAPLGEPAIVVGVAIWSLAFINKGAPMGCRDMRLLACRLGFLPEVDYDVTLAALEKEGLILRRNDEVLPLFYPEEEASFDSWKREMNPARRWAYQMVPSFLGPDFGLRIEGDPRVPPVAVTSEND